MFVFKGGTALQKVYGLNRFSIDLDFTAKEDNNKIDFKILIEKIAKKITDFGYNSSGFYRQLTVDQDRPMIPCKRAQLGGKCG